MSNVETEPLPHWAVGLASEYMEVGAVLPTRDGRAMGNATIVQIVTDHEHAAELGPIAITRTDAGNEMLLTRSELEEFFWPPRFVKSIDHYPRCPHGHIDWDHCPVCCH